MSLPELVSHDDWLVARKQLLAQEKERKGCTFPWYSSYGSDFNYGRGTEQVGGTHYYLDMTALGRQEDWEEPRGRSTGAPRADQVR